MTRVRLWLLPTLAMLSISLSAHPGGHTGGALRKWTLTNGRHIHATLHSFKADTVILEDGHHRLRHIALSDLHNRDAVFALDRIMSITKRVSPTVQIPVTPQPRVQDPTVVYGLTAIALLLIAALMLQSVRYRRAGRQRISFAYAAGMALVIGFSFITASTNATFKQVVLGTDPLTIDSTFALFKPHVSTRWNDTYFFVENDGMPTSMPAMVGITAWQQQVPIPQFYTGNNAWSIPLNPVPATVPVSLDTALHTGAVAIAVNGLPIFNPENNRGEFSQDIGELDAFGGHCGRADDYHYHIAPVHLSPIVGRNKPIAWALDGYPVFNDQEPDGSSVTNLDANLGHEWGGGYHYHAISSKPYLIARMRGRVTIQNDQVMPQAQTRGVRPFLQPLRGAEITEFHKCDSNHYALKYEVDGESRWVNYRWTPSGAYTYVFIEGNGDRRTENYQRK